MTKYECYACHGFAGKGSCDLRDADRKWATDAELERWIRDPMSIDPLAKMPTWDGVMPEEDYAPLIEYVRMLGRRSTGGAAGESLR